MRTSLAVIGLVSMATPTQGQQWSERALYIGRLSRTLAVALTASSPADAMSSAPVRFRRSFARVISSDVSQ